MAFHLFYPPRVLRCLETPLGWSSLNYFTFKFNFLQTILDQIKKRYYDLNELSEP